MKITVPMSALILTGAFGLAACGSKTEAPAPAAEPPPPAASAPDASAASAPADASPASGAQGGGDKL
jgi:hypothetical protein